MSAVDLEQQTNSTQIGTSTAEKQGNLAGNQPQFAQAGNLSQAQTGNQQQSQLAQAGNQSQTQAGNQGVAAAGLRQQALGGLSTKACTSAQSSSPAGSVFDGELEAGGSTMSDSSHSSSSVSSCATLIPDEPGTRMDCLDDTEACTGTREGPREKLADGRREGSADARWEGSADGRREGLADGRREGLPDGRREGLPDGLREGMVNGLREERDGQREEGDKPSEGRHRHGPSGQTAPSNERAKGVKQSPATSPKCNPYMYELFSIMLHSGTAAGGHYFAYIKYVLLVSSAEHVL